MFLIVQFLIVVSVPLQNNENYLSIAVILRESTFRFIPYWYMGTLSCWYDWWINFFSHHGRLFLADLFGFIWWNPKLKHENFFHKFHCLVNTQFHTKVKILRSDNGLEFDMPAVLWFPRHYSSKNLRWNSTTK